MNRQGGSYGAALLGLIFPRRPECLLCHEPDWMHEGEAVCLRCQAQLQKSRPPFCRVCGREAVRAGGCPDCVRRPDPFFQRAVSYGPFRGRMREALWKLKKERRCELAPFLSERLAEVWAAELFECGISFLVPVPMGEAARRERGFNQAEELARELGQRVGVDVCLALDWCGVRRGQATRSRRERLQGLEASVALSERAAEIDGKTVCLVDDVYTTGSTANACAQRLLEAGARAVYVLTVAR